MSHLSEFASVRTGDKGNSCILAVTTQSAEAFAKVKAQLTPDVIANHFGNSAENVSVTCLENLLSFTVVLRGQLDGGVTRSRRLDRHGKTLGAHLLTLEM